MEQEHFYTGKKFRAYCPQCERNRVFTVVNELDSLHMNDMAFPFMIKSIICGKCGTEMSVLPEEVFEQNEESKLYAFQAAERAGQI